MKTKFTLITLLLFSGVIFVQTTLAQNFVHPGLPFTINDLERMKANRESVSPWKESWDVITSSSEASLDYVMQGPAVDVENKGNDNLYISDVTAMLYHALQWYFTGDEAHAELAISLIDAWATTHKTWSGTSAHLGAAWRGGTMAQACEILRYTYPGWTDELTLVTEDYFETVFWPLFRLPNPLRAANQGANNLMGATYVAVYCNDQEKFEMCINAFVNDGCGGISNTLPNGENGDTGRDQGHAMGMIGNLATVCEIAWAQGIDLYSVLDNRLLAVHEYWCKYNLGNDVDYIGFGTCYDYYPTIGSDGRDPASASAIPVTEMVYGAYAVRKGLSAPYVSEYRDAMGIDPNNFLFAKDETFMTTAPFRRDPHQPLALSDVSSLTGADIGTVRTDGTENYSDDTWIIEGAGTNVYGGNNDAFHYAYKQVSGDGSFIAKVNAIEGSSSSAKAAVVIRESLETNSAMATMSLTSSGSAYNSRGFEAADGNGSLSDGDVTIPFWIKIERRGNAVVGYVSPDGENWAAQQNTHFDMADDYYIGLGVSSGYTSTLCTSTFTNVEYGVEDENAEELGDYALIQTEIYSNMSGVETQSTTDESGNEDVVAIQANDWMEYEVNVLYSGTYTMDYRVAGANGGDLSLTVDGDTLENISFESTGGADEWTTEHSAATFYLSKGIHTFKVTANSDDWKINWIRLLSECKDVPLISYMETIDSLGESFGTEKLTDLTIYPGFTAVLQPTVSTSGSFSWSGPNGFTSTESEVTLEDLKIIDSGDYIVTFVNECGLVNTDTFTVNVVNSLYFEAEDFTSMDSVSIEATDDVSGVSHITDIAAGDWIEYEIDVPFTALYTIDYRVASSTAGDFTTTVNGLEIEELNFDAGDWTTVSSASPIFLEEGLQIIRIDSKSEDWKLNWVELKVYQMVKPCALPYKEDGFRIYRESTTWTSGVMNITCETDLSLHVVLEGSGTIDTTTDYLNIYYRLDGGDKIPLVELNDSLALSIFSTEELTANTIEIIVEANEESTTGYFLIQNIYVVQSRETFSRIEAEDYDSKNGTGTEACSDTDGGFNVGSIGDGNWLMYSNIDMTDVHSISARLSNKSSSDGTVEVRLDSETGDLLGTINIPNTGSWQSWQTVAINLESVVGIYDLYLVFNHPTSYVGNINWIELSSDILPNTEALLTSSVYTVDQDDKMILNVPLGALVSTFESNLSLSEGATVTTYQADGVTEATEIEDESVVVVIAEDGVHKTTYTVEYLSSEAIATSDTYTVDQTNLTIVGVEDGTVTALVKHYLVFSEGATAETYEADGVTVVSKVYDGYKLVVTSEDETNSTVYTFGVPASIAETSIDGLSLYPNPVDDVLTIENQLGGNIEIYNQLGKKMTSLVMDAQQMMIPMGNYESGMYIVKISSDNKVAVFRVMKQ